MNIKLLTPAEVAALKGVTRASVYAAIKEERLPATRLLGRVAVRDKDAAAWTPAPGRKPGTPHSPVTRERLSAAAKRQWAQRKQQEAA